VKTATRHNWVGGVDNVVSETYTYGGVGGRVSRRDTNVGGMSFNQYFWWDDLGQIASVGYPSTTGEEPLLTVPYSYSSGYLTAVPGYASSISYSVNGMPYQIVRDNPLSYPDVTLTMGLDQHHMQRVASIATSGVTPPQDNWSTGSFAYDGAGNVTSIGSDSFEYDTVSRLTRGSLWVNGILKQQESTFDAFGNVTSTFTTDWLLQSFGVTTATNRLSAAGYDSAGNMTVWGTFTYGYDKLSRLQTVTDTSGLNHTYLYTADGERISDRNNQTGTTTLTIRDLGGKVLRVFVNGTRTKDYVWGNGMLLASVDASSTKRHFHLDHLGSPRLITDTHGAKVATHTYYPFGLEVPGGTADGERMKFTGHEREPYDHDYMHTRHYNPTTLRFLTPDLLRGDVHRPQAFNLFAYVGGNPVNYVDPFGFGDEEVPDLPPDVVPPSTLTFWGEVEVTAGRSWLPWLMLRQMLQPCQVRTFGDLYQLRGVKPGAVPGPAVLHLPRQGGLRWT